MATKKFTKVDFANALISVCNDEMELTDELKELFIEKATAILSTEENRKAYAEQNRKATGASEQTLALAKEIESVLTNEPQTSAEIAEILERPDLTALRIANVAKYIDGIQKTKVVRVTTDKKGLKIEKEFVAYQIK